MRKDNTRKERKRIDTETDKSRRIGTQKKTHIHWGISR